MNKIMAATCVSNDLTSLLPTEVDSVHLMLATQVYYADSPVIPLPSHLFGSAGKCLKATGNTDKISLWYC